MADKKVFPPKKGAAQPKMPIKGMPKNMPPEMMKKTGGKVKC